MIAIKIDISDQATPVIRAIGRAVRPDSLNPIVGRSAVNTFREHLFGVDRARPNALGGSRTHFYAAAARGTHFDVLPDGVMLSVNQVGIRQRVVGGTITPKKAKYLTIPARAEAHGKRASEFNDLVVVFGAGGRPVALARASQSLIGHKRDKVTGHVTGATKRGSAGGEILFWLRKSVTQQADPSVVPYMELVAQRIGRDVEQHINRAVMRARTAAAEGNS